MTIHHSPKAAEESSLQLDAAIQYYQLVLAVEEDLQGLRPSEPLVFYERAKSKCAELEAEGVDPVPSLKSCTKQLLKELTQTHGKERVMQAIERVSGEPPEAAWLQPEQA